MILRFSPVRADEQLNVSRQGDMLTVNSVALDFARLSEGATLPVEAIGSSNFVAPVERVDGTLVISLRLPHGVDAPESARFPADIVNPEDGQISLPGQELRPLEPAATGVIDWSMMVTPDQKAQAAAEQLLAHVVVETAQRRALADAAIAPLQDAADLDEASAAEVALLKEWKRYRIALNRLPDQPGYPATIDWPVPPA